MNSNINWLTLVLGMLFIRMDLVGTDPVCSDDYWPCTCEVIATATGSNQLRISCNQIRNVEIVQAVFIRTPPADVHSFYMTIPEPEIKDTVNIPRDFFHISRVRNIYLTCQTNQIPYLNIHPETFSSSKLFLENFHVDNCYMSNQRWNSIFIDFYFLKSLTFSRAKNYDENNFDYFPSLFSLTTLNLTHSNDFSRFLSMASDKFPYLVNLIINYSPNAIVNVGSVKNTNPLFKPKNDGLKIVVLNGNQIDDQSAQKTLEELSLSSNETMQSFSLMDNSLTRLPTINNFPNLTHLRLDNNNLTSENFSLADLNSNGLQTLTLSSCGLKDIKPGALEVGGDRFQVFQLKLLNLDNNDMTRFESSIFQNILQKMANRWEDPGVIHVHRNSFDCDCHLAWLIVDNRHLLRHVRGARCSDGLPFTKLESSQFAACNGTSGQLKSRLSS